MPCRSPTALMRSVVLMTAGCCDSERARECESGSEQTAESLTEIACHADIASLASPPLDASPPRPLGQRRHRPGGRSRALLAEPWPVPVVTTYQTIHNSDHPQPQSPGPAHCVHGFFEAGTIRTICAHQRPAVRARTGSRRNPSSPHVGLRYDRLVGDGHRARARRRTRE